MTSKPSTSQQARLVNALAGGWVADAAALGLHWVYSSQRIAEVGGSAPEFLPPKAEYYAHGVGYFAHEGKVVGDVSHYGAATAVLTESLLFREGRFGVRDYQRRFRDYFGPGGGWCGYIDNPTRITLANLDRIEQEAIDQGLSDAGSSLNEEQRRILVQKVLPYTRRMSGDSLADPIRRAISLTYTEEDVQEAGVQLALAIDRHLRADSGADDQQLPAVSKLPPLVACYLDDPELMEVVESAVRVTNHNDRAVAWARYCTRLLAALFQGEGIETALEKAGPEAPDREAIRRAQQLAPLNPVTVGDQFGRTCYLHEAVPVIVHILTHAESFAEAVRANILCGGDSCGRAWIIGPAMAAIHGAGGVRGIPLSWLAQVNDAAAIFSDIENLVAED
ncbi:ADP-ribosylglycohydrolase [Marinobacter daqiaonensis]|uniref:ADP-ribosylglycohydrolase n=1 Tax=Marinobacter daqiaonensis TaxID=650891 RepID=A0A1I6II74_9GAMM|nr:ADP-ribosylglycohydrolase family protein [Marinobacter daqiaonensis]SFR66403.1 ADP-ribosylglycohydrolase [Marinobacter daqiaonensis]